MKTYFILLIIIVATACNSSEEPKGEIFQIGGIAIGGYDPVAYFVQSEAMPGDPSLKSSAGGIMYQFANEENKALFDENPEKYIPAYGGWCAYAVAESSSKMEPDPTMWKIQDDKLMLFYDDWMTSLTGSLLEEWNTDEDGYMERADQNWETTK